MTRLLSHPAGSARRENVCLHGGAEQAPHYSRRPHSTDAAPVRSGGALKASNQRAAHLSRHLFACCLVAGKAPCRLQLLQIEINIRVHIESERVMRNQQVGFVCWLSAFFKGAT